MLLHNLQVIDAGKMQWTKLESETSRYVREDPIQRSHNLNSIGHPHLGLRFLLRFLRHHETASK